MYGPDEMSTVNQRRLVMARRIVQKLVLRVAPCLILPKAQRCLPPVYDHSWRVIHGDSIESAAAPLCRRFTI